MMKSLATKVMFAAGAAAVAISAGSAPAEAAIVTYTNRADWENALTNVVGLPSSSITSPEEFDNLIPSLNPITFDNGVVSTGNNGTTTNTVVPEPILGRYVGQLGTTPAFFYNTITWTFPEAVLGFGADWFNTNGGNGFLDSAAGLRVTIGSDSVAFGSLLGSPGTGFLGFISDTPFSSVTFSTVNSGNELFSADNLSYAVVPTPAMLPGLIGMGIAAWRKRKSEATESKA